MKAIDKSVSDTMVQYSLVPAQKYNLTTSPDFHPDPDTKLDSDGDLDWCDDVQGNVLHLSFDEPTALYPCELREGSFLVDQWCIFY